MLHSTRTSLMATLLALSALTGTAPAAEKAPVVRGASEGDYEERLARVEKLVQGQGLLDLLAQVEALQREVQRLKGQVEQQAYLIEQLSNKQRDLFADVDRRLQAIEGGGARAGTAAGAIAPPNPANPPLAVLDSTATTAPPTGVGSGNEAPSLTVETRVPAAAPAAPDTGAVSAPAAAPAVDTPPTTADAAPAPAPGAAATEPPPATAAAPTTGVPPTQVATAAPAVPADPVAADAAYEKAFNLLKAGRYDQAIAEFNNFMVSYPGSPRADAAQYWLGEAYYVSKQYQPAIGEYQKLVQAYPKSQKVPQALLKIGFSQHELGQNDQARATLDDVKQRYPGTTSARMAEDRLQRMRLEQNP